MSDHKTLQFSGVDFDVRNNPDKGIYFVLGIRKSGSSIFNNICTALGKFNDVEFVDIGGKMFSAGVLENEWVNKPEVETLLAPGNLYGGFRTFPQGIAQTATFKRHPKVLMVRDPRDVLVSEFFSNAYSHSLPEDGEGRERFEEERKKAVELGLEEYIENRIDHIARTCAPFVELKNDPLTKVFRYEDVIFEKAQLMRDVCDHFGWSITQGQIDAINSWADVRPQTENPTEFVRKVTPGDYKEKMNPKAQQKVIEATAAFSKAFDYS
ncbi:sulfotransferase domain-containing protein [Shimia thalassica]|jgi:hypothetical protein|uniref:sulfotransferase domain-containing protein n=1 Tax=Shimia thalassica TaxID=1715693 RepID=UPI001C0A0503|nr:sulfotransferase domain-containing protein [Shimia thalassica]MBU2942165.1 sulfotransferase domain-containing protein [Shimia thalassica]MDO6478365.1 sulfotransferase domain-containing protein [Shimia thalassica]MDO6482816.1 sulfotransferase domain-containing protein [Shimia thalassica]MDO6502865.1 sulfotransferase domain-containing protein [Shimia thalassica]MDO6798084.1 sulfotransferase domain-containing protein [Shimia thalassica]